MSIQLCLLFIYTQPSEILSGIPQNVKEPENYFLQLSHECRSSECWWSQHMFDHLTLEETSIWSYHICRVQMKPINSRFFFLSFLFLCWLFSDEDGQQTWRPDPHALLRLWQLWLQQGEPAENCGHHVVETRNIWSQMFTQGTGYLHFTGRNHMRWGLPFWNSIFSYLISISLADHRFSSMYLDWRHFINRLTGCQFFTEDFQTLAY